MYKYTIEQCDVGDRERLRKFRDKRDSWIAQLDGKDPNAIWNQMPVRLWEDVLFRTVADLRRASNEHPSEDVGFNETVLRFFYAGYFDRQAIAIRRLTDNRKGVISLRRLVTDIKNNRTLITRENYVAFDGRPYDFTIPRAKWLREHAVAGKPDKFPDVAFEIPTEGPEAWVRSQRMNEEFDELSDIGNGRSRTDLISLERFDWLDSQLDICKDVKTFVDNFVAHGAHPSTRTGLSESQIDVSLDQIHRCQKAIYTVASLVSGSILSHAIHSPVPTPAGFDHLENLDKGWIAKGKKEMARAYWNRNFSIVEDRMSDAAWPKVS